MYWTKNTTRSDKSVWKAGMDGSNITGLVTGSGDAAGIQIDFKTSRIYWADRSDVEIKSSNLSGGDVITIVPNATAYGLALLGDRLYWGDSDNQFKVESRRIQPGSPVRVEHTENFAVMHLTVSNLNPPKNRKNHCDEGRACPGSVCVLTSASYKCFKYNQTSSTFN